MPNPINCVDPLGLSACPPDNKSASKLDHLAEQWKTENTPPINRNLSGVAGSVTGGSSSKLGKNLNEAMGRKRADSWQGYQAQHLIPSELRNHPMLKIVGIDLDHELNGIFLPSTRNKPVGMISGKPRHTGSHLSYTNAVRQELNDMDRMLPIDQLEVQVYKLQLKLRRITETGMPVHNVDGAKTEVWARWLKK